MDKVKLYSLIQEIKTKLVTIDSDNESNSSTSKVIYLPDYDSIFINLRKANTDIKDLISGKNLDSTEKLIISNDEQIQKLAVLINDTFTKYRTYIRNNHPDIYSKVKNNLNEDNITSSISGYNTKKLLKKNTNDTTGAI